MQAGNKEKKQVPGRERPIGSPTSPKTVRPSSDGRNSPVRARSMSSLRATLLQKSDPTRQRPPVEKPVPVHATPMNIKNRQWTKADETAYKNDHPNLAAHTCETGAEAEPTKSTEPKDSGKRVHSGDSLSKQLKKANLYHDLSFLSLFSDSSDSDSSDDESERFVGRRK